MHKKTQARENVNVNDIRRAKMSKSEFPLLVKFTVLILSVKRLLYHSICHV